MYTRTYDEKDPASSETVVVIDRSAGLGMGDTSTEKRRYTIGIDVEDVDFTW